MKNLSERILEDHDDGISSEEHLGDETILRDWALLLAFACSRDFSPHFLDVLQNHVEMPENNINVVILRETSRTFWLKLIAGIYMILRKFENN